MKDIHSIGQAFKIVSGGTAKGEVDSEGSNLSEVSVRDTKPIASQESSPQKVAKYMTCECGRYLIERKTKLYVDGRINRMDKYMKKEIKQAREEMLKEIRTKMTKKLKHYVPDFLTKSDFMMINQGLLKEIK